MKKFSKNEILSILIIFVFLAITFSLNLSVSIRRGRDNVRKDDISALQKSIEAYYIKFGIYPLSNDSGQIVGCFNAGPQTNDITGYPENAVPCVWGESRFENVNLMPRDPSYEDGSSYKYLSIDGKRYEIYIALEGESEAEYTPSIVMKNLQCGTKICNYGRVVN